MLPFMDRQVGYLGKNARVLERSPPCSCTACTKMPCSGKNSQMAMFLPLSAEENRQNGFLESSSLYRQSAFRSDRSYVPSCRSPLLLFYHKTEVFGYFVNRSKSSRYQMTAALGDDMRQRRLDVFDFIHHHALDLTDGMRRHFAQRHTQQTVRHPHHIFLIFRSQ